MYYIHIDYHCGLHSLSSNFVTFNLRVCSVYIIQTVVTAVFIVFKINA